MEKYTICLAPQKENGILLTKIITHLATKYNSYPFIPHLTIYGGLPDMKKEIVKKAVDFALKDIQPFTIRVEKITYSDFFYKTLFLEIKSNKTLLKIHSLLREKLKKYHDYILKPHISLVYKHNLPNTEKGKIIRSLDIKKKLTLDKCLAIGVDGPLGTEEEIKRWKVIYEKKLIEKLSKGFQF